MKHNTIFNSLSSYDTEFIFDWGSYRTAVKTRMFVFLFSGKLEHQAQGRTFIVLNSNFIFWWGWCSGSHWRQFNWFGLYEFIWEHRLSVNNQLDCMNIFFSKCPFIRRNIKSERFSAHLHLWMSMLFLHYLIYYSQVCVKWVLPLSPFGEKTLNSLHRFTQGPTWRK